MFETVTSDNLDLKNNDAGIQPSLWDGAVKKKLTMDKVVIKNISLGYSRVAASI